MKYTLEQRIERARTLHGSGHNCAQAVAMVFDDVTPLREVDLVLAAAAFGGGIAGTRGTCGCVSGMAIVDGAVTYSRSGSKAETYSSARPLVEEFGRLNGSVVCDDLRRPGKKPCIDLIIEAVTLLHNHLSAK